MDYPAIESKVRELAIYVGSAWVDFLACLIIISKLNSPLFKVFLNSTRTNLLEPKWVQDAQ